MVVTPRAQRALIVLAIVLLAVIYSIAWLAPAVGLYHDDGVYLVTARSIAAGHGYMVDSLPNPVAQTKYPPVFPSLLALFSLVSMSAQWLKLLPVLCALGWLYLTWQLLRKMGATANSAWFLVLVTAASPSVIFLNTNLMSESLFGLLLTASLLVLIDGRNPLLAGILAGLATDTRIAGVPLIAAGIFTLLMRKRFYDAVKFTAGAAALAAPWFGWAAAHRSVEPYYGVANYSSLNILTGGLLMGEKFRVLVFNILFLASAPYTIITGFSHILAGGITALFALYSFVYRRQLVPDLFLGFYCLLLLTWAGPPQRFLVPVLPLVLWFIWRWMQDHWSTEAVAALVVLALAVQVFVDFQRVPATLRSGVFAATGQAIDEWPQMMRLCDYLRSETPPESIVLANLDPVIFLNTHRRAVRGFSPNGYDLFYSSTRRPVQALELLRSIETSKVNYVVLSPDRDFAEAPGFLAAVLTLEREGKVEPVPISGLTSEYRLLKVTGY